MSNESRPWRSEGWWPGRWLRLVYGVWVDQVWYWRHVRPYVPGQQQGWSIFIQGTLGSALVTVVLLAVLFVAWQAAGIPVDLRAMGVDAAIALAFAFGAALLMALWRLATGVVAEVVGGVVIPVAFVVLQRVPAGVAMGTVIGVAGGIYLGVSVGVDRGVRRRVADDLLVAVVAAVLLGISTGIASGVAGGVTFVLAAYSGALWATRQIPDEDTRRRLANPEAISPRS